jgi:hypothetical protein
MLAQELSLAINHVAPRGESLESLLPRSQELLGSSMAFHKSAKKSSGGLGSAVVAGLSALGSAVAAPFRAMTSGGGARRAVAAPAASRAKAAPAPAPAPAAAPLGDLCFGAWGQGLARCLRVLRGVS